MERLGLTKYQRRDRISKEIISSYQHKSGFRMDFLPRVGFSQKFASVVLPFGSVDRSFLNTETNEIVRLPLGTMYLLAKIIFEVDRKDSLAAELEKMGITSTLRINHEHLIFKVNTVDFYHSVTELIVKKIIEFSLDDIDIELYKRRLMSEIELSANSDSLLSYELRKSLYKEEEIFTNVRGTVESVSSISRDDLELCLNNIFALRNISMILVADTAEDTLITRLVDALDRYEEVETNLILNPLRFERQEIVPTKELSWQRPNPAFAIGYRLDLGENNFRRGGKDNLQLGFEVSIILEMLIGAGSESFEELRASGLLGDKIDFNIYADVDYAFVEIKGSSLKPDLTAKVISESLERQIAEKKFDEEAMNLNWNARVGRFMRDMDSIEEYGYAASTARINGIEFADFTSLFNEIKDKGERVLDTAEFIKTENRAIVICYSNN